MVAGSSDMTARGTGIAAPAPARLATARPVAPAPDDRALPRPALCSRVEDALHRGSLAVTAPAGSGKTHLVAQWWHRAQDVKRAWLTLDDADREPATFLRSLLQAARSADHHAQGGAAPAEAAGTPTGLPELTLALSQLSEPVVVVLDDLHRVAGSATEELLAQMMHSSPEPLRLVLVGRGVPRLGLERAHFGGWVDHLTAQDLALTELEVEELVRLRAPARSTVSSAEIWQRTRGWVLGALIELEDLSAGQRRTMLEDYFEAEVLGTLSPSARRVLEHALRVDPVCGALLDALTGESGGAVALEELYRADAFLEPTGPDDRCAWYRWQPQFRSVETERLARHDPRLTTALHRAAVRWLRAEGHSGTAAIHALAAGDRGEAIEMLSRDWLTLLATGHVREIDEVLARLTEQERASRPELSAACAVVRAVENDLTRSCRCAELAVTGSGPAARERRLTIEAASVGVHLYRATLTGVGDGAAQQARTLLDHLDPTRSPRSDTELALLSHLAHQLAAWDLHRLEVDEAHRLLTVVVDLATRLGDQDLLVRSEALLARVEAVTGHLAKALDRAAAVLADVRGAARARATATAELATAEVLLQRGRPLEALSHLDEARGATPEEDRVSRVDAALLRMSALLVLGRVTAAREQLETLRNELPDGWSAVPLLEDQLRVAEARQLLGEGDAEGALRVLPETTSGLPHLLATRMATTRARALHLLGGTEPTASGTPPEPAPAPARPDEAPDVIAALLRGALDAHRAGRLEEALRITGLAVHCSSAEQVALPFHEVAAEIRPLLQDLVAAGTTDEEWALSLVERMTNPSPMTSTGIPYVEPLTARELEVLRALQGTSRPEEIAARLFVSMNTLRTHLKHINRKLGTGSRREAVTRARELSLL